MQRTPSVVRRSFVASLVLSGALATSSGARAGAIPEGSGTDEPVTIAILVSLGTSLAVTLIYDQSTANFLSTALGYAKPQPDADFAWHLGRGEATAFDFDVEKNNLPFSRGSASASVNWVLPDTLDPKDGSYGAYHNVVRTYKNGSLRNVQTGGQPDPNDGVSTVTIDINGFTTDSGHMTISITGGTDTDTDGAPSLNAIYKLGAEFDTLSNRWIAWLPTVTGLDPVVESYYNEGNFGEPSIAQIAQAASAPSCLDFSGLLVGALNAGTMVSGSQIFVGSISLTLDIAGAFDAGQDPTLNWWQSVQAEAAADIPTPGASLLLAIAGACFAYPRKRA